MKRCSEETVFQADGHSALLKVRELEGLVEKLVASWQDSRVMQNRRWHRIRYKKPIAITPLDDATELVVGETRLVCGHDLSPAGVSFTHQTLLPHRKMAATFAVEPPVASGPDAAPTDSEAAVEPAAISVVVLLTWCRFTNRGYYRSGGRFLRTIRLGSSSELDWSQLRRA